MLYHFVLLSLIALVNAVAPSNGFFRILDFENRSVDLHNKSPADYDPIQTYNSSAGELAQKVGLSSSGLSILNIAIAFAVALEFDHRREPMAH